MRTPDTLHISTLSGDWCDKDIVMLHACFQLLSDCVEKEKLLTGDIDWNYTGKHKKIKKEIKAIYEWWLTRKNEDNPVMINEQERLHYKKDTEMLMRLIKIRAHLWT